MCYEEPSKLAENNLELPKFLQLRLKVTGSFFEVLNIKQLVKQQM